MILLRCLSVRLSVCVHATHTSQVNDKREPRGKNRRCGTDDNKSRKEMWKQAVLTALNPATAHAVPLPWH